MPVSKTWASVSISSNAGGSRWIGSMSSAFTAPLPSIGWPSTSKTRPSVASPTGHGDRRAGVDDVEAAGQAVGRRHRDGAHPVVAEVLLHLDHQRRVAVLSPSAALDLERVVDVGQLARRELDIDHGARDLDHLTGRHRSVSLLCLSRQGFGPGGDLDHLAGDGGLARLVVDEGQVLDELVGVVGRVAHGDHPGALLGRLVLEHGSIEVDGHEVRQQPAEHRSADGSKMYSSFSISAPAACCGLLDRQQLRDLRPLRQRD